MVKSFHLFEFLYCKSRSFSIKAQKVERTFSNQVCLWFEKRQNVRISQTGYLNCNISEKRFIEIY